MLKYMCALIFFFFNDTATTEIYTLSLHDALPICIVGFCWGGRGAWRAACNRPSLSAAACYYGGGMTTPLEMGREPLCPVIAHFGRRDSHIPVDAVQAFAQAQKHVQVHLYDADHGFNCDQRSAYDEASALQARDRTLAFFDQQLA